MSGLKLAALYGLKPHQLGFCGPQDKETKNILFKYLKGGKTKEKRVRKILEDFEGAYPYLKKIAKSNNIQDPFNEKVVRAYWIGNELLEKTKNPKLHHSFHILMVGSVTGRIVLEGKLLDLCRVGWGKVIELKAKSQKLKVEYQPLVGKKKLKLGRLIRKEIDWNKNLISNIRIGDWISFHWNQTIEVLNKKDIKNLEKYTKNSLNIHNKNL